jgi:hypothetical protein
MQGYFEKTPEHDKSHRFAMGKWPFGVHLARGVYFVENKLTDFQISGTVFFY